ncbi:MAG: hypothetical protein IJD63_01215 [Oscillospiraceae bacterium]|nr:hypothetical protein [Oscillospiraceae bacterium]
MEQKRLTLFAGHYGSGKTNIAVNYSLYLRKLGYPVTVADLDIVNPYFRTKDSAAVLESAGIELISSPFANSNLDVPAMPPEVYRLVADRTRYGVLDIGGDDRGALALGRYVPMILEENDYEMLFVINKSRPLTRDVAGTLEVMEEIETACGLKFTAIVNNTNLGKVTTVEDILASESYAKAVSEKTGLPIKMTTVNHTLLQHLPEGNFFPLYLQELYYEIKTEDTLWRN